jgi:hypothetical protein
VLLTLKSILRLSLSSILRYHILGTSEDRSVLVSTFRTETSNSIPSIPRLPRPSKRARYVRVEPHGTRALQVSNTNDGERDGTSQETSGQEIGIAFSFHFGMRFYGEDLTPSPKEL